MENQYRLRLGEIPAPLSHAARPGRWWGLVGNHSYWTTQHAYATQVYVLLMLLCTALLPTAGAEGVPPETLSIADLCFESLMWVITLPFQVAMVLSRTVILVLGYTLFSGIAVLDFVVTYILPPIASTLYVYLGVVWQLLMALPSLIATVLTTINVVVPGFLDVVSQTTTRVVFFFLSLPKFALLCYFETAMFLRYLHEAAVLCVNALDPRVIWAWIFANVRLYIESHYCPPPQTFLFFWTWSQPRYCQLYNSYFQVQPVLSGFDTGLTYLLLIAILYLITMAGYPFLIAWLHDLASTVLDRYAQRSLRVENLRSEFRDRPFEVKGQGPKGNAHAKSAKVRNTAQRFAQHYADMLALHPYWVSRTRADERAGRMGSRMYTCARDLTAAAKVDPVREPALFVFSDADHHIDMPYFLAKNFSPTLLYVFQPETVAANGLEYSFTFDRDNMVKMQYAGGGSYHHPVWNYSSDTLKATWKVFGIPYRTATYVVDRRSCMEHRSLILLMPTAAWNWPLAWFADWFLDAPTLDRLKIATADSLRMFVQRPKGLFVSTGVPDQYAHAEVPAEVDCTLGILSKSMKTGLSIPTVTSFTNGDRTQSAVLHQYHAHPSSDSPPYVVPVDQSVHAYHFNPKTTDESYKPIMVPFMNPLIDGTYVPTDSPSTEAAAIDGRVQNTKPEFLEASDFIHSCMKEFAKLLVGDQVLHPTDYDEVYDRQARPAQRAILAQSEALEPIRVIASFTKRESYPDIKDPRNISTINGVDKVRYSQYMYPFAELMKAQPWYAFGRTPLENATRVTEIATNSKRGVVETDFSRFDGHGSNLMRDLERLCLLAAFAPQYHPELLELHRSQYGLTAYTKTGIKYHTEWTRASGSPETSNFNSLVNAFVAYCTFRKSVNGKQKSMARAWSHLGIYGGDDGLTADIDVDSYVKTAASIGQVLKAEMIPKGTPGVTFLARWYGPEVWFNDPTNSCDVVRQLRKFHVTVRLSANVSPLDKFLEKCRALLLTDARTPVLGELASRAQELHNQFPQETRPEYLSSGLTSYWATFNAENQFPQPNDTQWVLDRIIEQVPDFDYSRFKTWLASVKKVEELLTPPLLAERPPPVAAVPVVLDEEILPLGTPDMGPDQVDVGERPVKALPSQPSSKGKERDKSDKGPPKPPVNDAAPLQPRKDDDALAPAPPQPAPAQPQPGKGPEKKNEVGKPQPAPQKPGRRRYRKPRTRRGKGQSPAGAQPAAPVQKK